MPRTQCGCTSIASRISHIGLLRSRLNFLHSITTSSVLLIGTCRAVTVGPLFNAHGMLYGQLLNTDGTLKEVADVLRHRKLDTSLIYAKIDFAMLGAVVMPWPGRQS